MGILLWKTNKYTKKKCNNNTKSRINGDDHFEYGKS